MDWSRTEQRDRHGTWFSLAHRELPEVAQAGLRAGERHAVIRLVRTAPSRASTVAFAVRGSRLPLRGSTGLAMHEHNAPASRFILRAVSRWNNLTAPLQWLIRYVRKSSQRTPRNSLRTQEITKSVDLAGNCGVSSFMACNIFQQTDMRPACFAMRNVLLGIRCLTRPSDIEHLVGCLGS